MVAISVTEPNIGSDVASVSCRAEPATRDGGAGWLIDGAKAWCTFAGRANVLALLARTDPDTAKGARGLSLFIVEKPRFDGHEFVAQPGRRRQARPARPIARRAIAACTRSRWRSSDWFVPADNLVGESGGLGKGFYLQMAGFAAGRLQTGGRACGVAQAALERTAEYVVQPRPVRQADHRVRADPVPARPHGVPAGGGARASPTRRRRRMDEDERAAAPLAAQAKLFACDVAVEVTQAGQLLHGGWGYAEEYAISRYVVDALVLPIFEGVKPILELKVVARALLAG